MWIPVLEEIFRCFKGGKRIISSCNEKMAFQPFSYDLTSLTQNPTGIAVLALFVHEPTPNSTLRHTLIVLSEFAQTWDQRNPSEIIDKIIVTY